MVICPGGGYMKLCMDYEGYDAARWFAANGVTAAVLKYRLPEGHPEVPLEDAVQALRIMAGLEAGATGYTADRVGIAGFSAGGHLAAAVSTLGTFKPAFSILFYPVTGDGESPGCRITFDRLLGGRRTDAAVAAAWSPSRQVTAETPPALLFHSDDDATVPPSNSTAYYDALKRHGIEASLHIYPSGGHGWGLLGSFPYRETWQRAVLDWLDRLCAVPDGERRR